MQNLKLPFIKMPEEFTTLLKSSVSVTNSASPVFDVLRKNRALGLIIQTAFKEFDDGRGMEKVLLALGWENYRERLASIYLYREIHGQYPVKTDMNLVEDIKINEAIFISHGVHTHSRTFLLAFYLKIAEIQASKKDSQDQALLKFPTEIAKFLNLSQGRSEKTDWLILILWHFSLALGEKTLIGALSSGLKFEEIYSMIPSEVRVRMHENLLSYGASINEPEIFFYDKV